MTPELRAELEAMGVDVRVTLDRIEAKLERIERTLDRLLPADVPAIAPGWRCGGCNRLRPWGEGTMGNDRCECGNGTRWRP